LKLGVAGLSHETITFQPGLSRLEDFERFALYGPAIIEERKGTETYEGGFIDICEPAGVEFFPVCETFGGVAGIVADDVYNFYIDKMKNEFGKVANELDGILLNLQGNIVTESLEETESHLVRDIREVVGSEIPIMAAMDLHANVSPALLDWTTVICADHCSPHIDKREVGRRTARIMLATLNDEVKPTVAMAKPGIAVPTYFPFGNTFNPPGSELTARRKEWEKHQRVLDVSIFYGFATADVPQIGMSMVAVTDNDLELAQEIVEDLSQLAIEKRKGLSGKDSALNVEEGVEEAIEKAKHSSRPILIFDPANHSYDTTYVIKELITKGAKNVAVPVLYDPEAAQTCVEAGAGSTVELDIGGKSGWRDGDPLKVRVKVLWAGEHKYIGRGARAYNLGTSMTRKDQHIKQGPTATIEADGTWIQLTSYKSVLSSEAPFKLFGRDPRDFDIIVTRSYSRECYSKIIEETVMVDSKAQCPADPSVFKWKNVPPGVYPINSDSPRVSVNLWKR
jgi:microcystin degradation protein MlrC